jgi:8-oxo-dGTP pyrophosphatase MutT (NUDIX family)
MPRTPEAQLDMSEGSGIRTAVDILVVDPVGRVLLGQHFKNQKKVWGFVGGHQKTGETIAQTAQRELAEELGPRHGVEITSTLMAVRENCIAPWFVPHLTVVILGKWSLGAIEVAEPHRTVQWQWCDPSAPPRPLFSGVEEILRAYLDQAPKIVTDWQSPNQNEERGAKSDHPGM